MYLIALYCIVFDPLKKITLYLKFYQNWNDLILIDLILKFKYKLNQINKIDLILNNKIAFYVNSNIILYNHFKHKI